MLSIYTPLLSLSPSSNIPIVLVIASSLPIVWPDHPCCPGTLLALSQLNQDVLWTMTPHIQFIFFTRMLEFRMVNKLCHILESPWDIMPTFEVKNLDCLKKLLWCCQIWNAKLTFLIFVCKGMHHYILFQTFKNFQD